MNEKNFFGMEFTMDSYSNLANIFRKSRRTDIEIGKKRGTCSVSIKKFNCILITGRWCQFENGYDWMKMIRELE